MRELEFVRQQFQYYCRAAAGASAQAALLKFKNGKSSEAQRLGKEALRFAGYVGEVSTSLREVSQRLQEHLQQEHLQQRQGDAGSIASAPGG